MKMVTNITENLRNAIEKLSAFVKKQPSNAALISDEDGNVLVVLTLEAYENLKQSADHNWYKPTWIWPTYPNYPVYPKPTWNSYVVPCTTTTELKLNTPGAQSYLTCTSFDSNTSTTLALSQ